MDILDKFVNKRLIERQLLHSEVYHYLDKYREKGSFIVPELKGNKGIRLNRTIWIYWQQGMGHAPELVRRCYESVCGNKPEDFDIVLLSNKNLSQYIKLPDYICEKWDAGYITTTHLSDLIRMDLLCTYGGCWIDATVFCSGKIPRYMLSGDLFFFQLAAPETFSVLKMSSWWIYSNRNNRLLHLTRQMLLRYWEKETDIRSYYLLHIVMSKIIDEDWASRESFQGIPFFNSGNAHVLQSKLGAVYNENEWEVIKEVSSVHKLTYKTRYLRGDLYNYYSALMEGRLA